MTFLYVWSAAVLVCGAITALKGKWGVFCVGFLLGIAWILGAFRLARPDSWWARRAYSEEKLSRAQARIEDTRYQQRIKVALAGTAVAVFLLFAASFLGFFKLYRIPSSAMEPTLICAETIVDDGCSGSASDRVVAIRYTLGREPERGDIAAFETPPAAEMCGAGGVFVKRIVGMPGDRLRFRDGHVYVNDEVLDEPYVAQPDLSTDTFRGERAIPEGEYFVLGDNRGQSCDSRVWGTVPRENFIGEVVWRYWPVGRAGSVG